MNLHLPPSAPGDVWPALWETFVETRHLHADLLRRDHVSLGQHLALRWVREAESLKVSALADALGISRPAATSLVTSLESRGWVSRRHSEKDRREVVVRITPRAERMLHAFDREVASVVRASTERLPLALRRQTAEALHTLCAHIREQRLHDALVGRPRGR